MKKMRDIIRDTARSAAHEWFSMQAQNTFQALYAYFRKPVGEEEICTIVISEDRPDEREWHLITNERLSPAWTEEQCAAKLIDCMNRNLPILNPAVEYNV